MKRIVDDGIVIVELSIVGSTDSIILLDPERRPVRVLEWHPFPNIMRVTSAGGIVWRSALVPEETAAKSWHSVSWLDGKLLSQTYSYDCELDPNTGRLIQSTFTK